MLAPKPWKPSPFTWATSTLVREHAEALTGATAGQLAAAVNQHQYNATDSAKGKTGVGALVEWYFGKPPNNVDQPDIPELGIEIKTIPLEVRGRKTKKLGPKEPTSLTMMDYLRIHAEPWGNAYLRKKIQHILWVPYVHDFDDKRLHRFEEPFLWRPDPEDYPFYETDYECVRKVISEGRAQDLTETLSVVLAARRKGEGGDAGPREQPCSPTLAPSRAWAFKTAYTWTILDRHNGVPTTSLIELAHKHKSKSPRSKRVRLGDVDSLNTALQYVLQEFRAFEGKDTKTIMASLGGALESSKNRHSAAVRAIIHAPRTGNLLELEKLGIRLHVLDVNKETKTPFEAVSFPAMVLRTFAEEEWDGAQFTEHVDRIVFVPTFSKSGALDETHTLGRAFLWEPTQEDWGIMEGEWRTFQGHVKACSLKDAPDESATKRIHMRPKGRRGSDFDVDPCGNEVTKQCFWLNKRFVGSLLAVQARR